MRKHVSVLLAIVLILPAMLFTVSCAKKVVESQPATITETPSEQPAMTDTAAQEKAAAEAARLKAEELERQRQADLQRSQEYQAAVDKFVNEDIHFEFDSAGLSPEAQMILADKADFMRTNGNVSVTIEGNCDERGTDAYNMALGERRAEAVKAYLVNLGIAEYRFTTISYGEERPIDPGHNEAAWAKNRRVHIALD